MTVANPGKGQTVTFWLSADVVADSLTDILVTTITPQDTLEICFIICQQTGPKPAFGREAQAIAT